MKYFFLTLSLLSFSSCKPSTDLHRSVLDEGPTIKTGLPFYDGADLTPKWPSRGVVAAPAFHKVQPFQFLDQNGRKVTAQTFDKKIYVANFFFTSCGGICPRMIENMRMLQEEFADDGSVALLSHSVTPEVDTVSALKSYAEVKGVRDDRWYLATGRRAAIYKTARQSYFADSAPSFDRGKNDFLHTEKFFLVDKERRIRGVYNGTRLMDIRRLIDDIRTLTGRNSRHRPIRPHPLQTPSEPEIEASSDVRRSNLNLNTTVTLAADRARINISTGAGAFVTYPR